MIYYDNKHKMYVLNHYGNLCLTVADPGFDHMGGVDFVNAGGGGENH